MLFKALRILIVTVIVMVAMVVVGGDMLTEVDIFNAMVGLPLWLTLLQFVIDGKKEEDKREKEAERMKAKIKLIKDKTNLLESKKDFVNVVEEVNRAKSSM